MPCVTSVMVNHVRPEFPRPRRTWGDGSLRPRPSASVSCPAASALLQRSLCDANADLSVITDPTSDKFDLEAAIKHWAGEKA